MLLVYDVKLLDWEDLASEWHCNQPDTLGRTDVPVNHVGKARRRVAIPAYERDQYSSLLPTASLWALNLYTAVPRL